MLRVQVVEPEAHPLERPRLEVLDQHVGRERQRAAPRALPSSVARSIVTDRLFRFTERKYVATPSASYGGPHSRVSSPVPGRSTLTTSAPRSASSIVAYGPASTREKSAIRTPSSAPGIATL